MLKINRSLPRTPNQNNAVKNGQDNFTIIGQGMSVWHVLSKIYNQVSHQPNNTFAASQPADTLIM